MLNRLEWAQLLTASYKQLEGMLAQRQCKLANTEGNKYRVVEAVQKSFGGVEPETPTVQDIAARMFQFVREDTNALIKGQPGGGQLFWEIKPLNIRKYEEQKHGVRLPTHIADKPKKVSPVSPEAQREAKEQIERLCASAGLHELTSRAATIHKFVREQIESGADLSKAIPTIKKILAEPDLKRAVQILNEFRAGGTFDFSGGSFYSGQGFNSGGGGR
jgi:hypothetical protein